MDSGGNNFSKERRLESQITIGLLTDQGGFPLMVSAFEGNPDGHSPERLRARTFQSLQTAR